MQPDDYKSIDLYLQNELLPEEIEAFQQRLQTDSAFAAELDMRQSMNNYLKAKASQPALEEQMKELGSQYFRPPAKMKKLTDRRWLIGIAAAAIVGFLLWVLNPFSTPDLYAQYAQHQPLSISEKSTAVTFAAEAEQAFNAGNYQLAYEKLASYLTAKPADNQARLAYGIAALELNNIAAAQQVFQQLQAGNSVFKSAGKWYLALSYLKTGDHVAAKSTLQQIAPDDPDYGQKAEELLNALE